MSSLNPIPIAASDDPLAIGSKPSAALVEKLTPRQRLMNQLTGGALSVVVVLIALAWSVPTFGLFVSSFRPARDIQSTGWWSALVPPWHFTIENYAQVISSEGIGPAFLHSLIIAIPGTILPVLVAAFAAYAFSWMHFPGRDWIFLIIVAMLVVPIQTALSPILELFTNVHLTGSYTAIWLAHTAFGLPFSVYLLRNFFSALPADLFESARIDGASHVRIFTNILLPLAVPALASLVIFQFMWVWNDLLVALIFLGGNPDKSPLTVNIAGLVNSFGSNYEVLTAAAFISMALPLVIFFSLQRYFVRGLLAGSVKG